MVVRRAEKIGLEYLAAIWVKHIEKGVNRFG